MRPRGRLLVLLLLMTGGACSESVSPDRQGAFPLLFSIRAASSISANEDEALGRAFDKVDSYRVIVTDSLTKEMVADTVIVIAAGLTSHTLDISIPDGFVGRILTLEIIAFLGDAELFRTETAATVEMETSGTGTGEPIFVTVRYTGPGLRGSVATPGGESISGVTVSLLRDGSLIEEVVTAADGSFLFIDLLPGDYVVRPTTTGDLQACPGQRDVTLESGTTSLVAAFVLRTGSCTVRVLVVSGGDFDDTSATAAQLAGDPEISVETFFFLSELPGLDKLKRYDVVLLYMNGLFNESSSLGSEVAAFVSLGGNVVFGSFYWQGRSGSDKETTGWGALEGIDPFASAGGAVYRDGFLGSVTPHGLTHGLLTLASTGFWGGVTASGGTTVVARWNDGTPLVGYRTLSAGQRMVGVSLFPAHSTAGGVSGDTGALWKNAVRWTGAAGGPARVGVVVGGG